MSANVGYATLTVIPSAKGFSKALGGDVNPAMKSAGEAGGAEMSSGILGKAKALLGPAMALLGTAAIGSFVKGSISAAGDLEQSIGAVDAVFKGSAGQMHSWAATAATSVGITKNEYNGLGALIGSQLKNGGTSMDQLAGKTNDLIGVAADLSAQFGGSTSEAVEALSSALKGERDPIEKYGVSLNQAKIDAEAAALGFTKVGGALSTEANQAATISLIMKQTADAHGAFARETDTLAHKQQVLNAMWEDGKAKIGSAFLPAITAAAGGLTSLLGPAIDGATGFASKLGDAIAGAGATFGPALATIGSSLGPVVPQLLQLVSAISPLGLVVKAAGPQLAQLAVAVGSLLSGALTAILPPLTSMTSTLVELLAGVLSGVLPALTSFTGWLTDNLPWLTAIAAGIGGVVLAMKAYEVIIGIVKIASIAWAAIQTILNVVLTANPIGVIVLAIAALVAAIIWVATQTTFFQDVWTAVSSFLVTTWQSIASFASSIWQGILDFVTGVWTNIVSFVTTYVTAVQTTIAAVLGAISTAWVTAWNAIASFLGGLWDSIVQGVSNGIGKVVAFFSGLQQTILGILAGAGKWLLDTGQNLIQGFLDGINNAWKWVEGAVRDLFGGAVDLVKGILGIHSPSRVMRGIGQNTGEGFALGLEDMEKRIADASEVLQPVLPSGVASASLGIDADGSIVGADDGSGNTYIDYKYTQVGGNGLTSEQELRKSAQRLKQAIRK